MKKKSKTDKSFFLARAGFIIALAAVLSALVAAFCTRYGLWKFTTGITVFRCAAYAAVAGSALSLIGLVASLRIVIQRGFFLAFLGLLIGGTVGATALYWRHVADSVPPIHDITTDTQDPPKFDEILRLLKSADNSPVYGGKKVAAQQKRSYPEIVPLILRIPPGQAFDRALSTARSLGWQIIDDDKSAGRIEAVATTFWFGFRDDIVVRVRPEDAGSRVDIRSESRVGVSDLGKNAERIRKFLTAMKE
ncbi:MAG: DUF1499 domain-containing protein [Candidatus Sulfobium sp.]|jgi:uncharacterized protein (DUF1499 family)